VFTIVWKAELSVDVLPTYWYRRSDIEGIIRDSEMGDGSSRGLTGVTKTPTKINDRYN
jgi:hypothetical protein